MFLFRTYEHVSDVGLFLFNDALMLTRRNVHHTPFTLTHKSTHTFLASVSLCSLAVREITHTRCEFHALIISRDLSVWKLQDNWRLSADVSHAFVLEGPCRSWVCATERHEEREKFLCVLRSAVKLALRGHQWRRREKTRLGHHPTQALPKTESVRDQSLSSRYKKSLLITKNNTDITFYSSSLWRSCFTSHHFYTYVHYCLLFKNTIPTWTNKSSF